MNAFEGYLLKQHLTGTFTSSLSKLAAERLKYRPFEKAMRERSSKARAATESKARAAAEVNARTAAEAGLKGLGSEAADSAMKMGKGSKAALLAAILAAGGTTAAVGAKAYKRSRPTPKASAKQKLVAMIKRNPKKSVAAGATSGALATLAALAANK